MIRTRSESPLERKRTEVETHRVITDGVGGVECIIEQSIYKVLSERYAPTKLVIFTLSPDDADALAKQLLDHARQARGG